MKQGFEASLELMGIKMPHARNEEIYGQDEPAGYVYKVVKGAVRTHTLLDDGRRQIGAFYLPGDIFGLELGASHRFSAEAISDTVVLAIKRSTLTALAQSDAVVARELWLMTARELDHVQDQMILLGRSSAKERVASFLIEMADRSKDRNEIDLPMSRQDIADYLGLTIETVSRTFSSMERKALIELPTSRKVRLRNRTALRLRH
ncbi:MAG: helix-turn-helix domain-containing protein [Xanthobacteraceae bacterium]|nr:helix-turn-helix domain-containing protein [Xanthobacteraceae bacterium]MCW5678880.1 helix-turn-helix domain-containing protein [Xanthobacteraceae bacterium]